MKKPILLALAVSALVTSSLSSAVFAQGVNGVPGHPRVNQIDQRLDNQQKRINEGVEEGKINPTQAAKDEKRDVRVADQLSKDEAKHDGRITKGEQRRMNKELNKNGHRIHRQRHHHHKKEVL